MALRSAGSLSRSLASTARVSLHHSAPTLRRIRPPISPATRRFSFTSPRNLGELGCTQSLLHMRAATCLTSHLTVNLRAYCELSHGIFCRIASSLFEGMEKMGDVLGLTIIQKAEE